MNSPWSRYFHGPVLPLEIESETTCAVPVLPAISVPSTGRRARPAVPGPLTTSLIAFLTYSTCSSGKSILSKPCGLVSSVRRGITCLPVARREAITASCKGLESM